MQKSTKPVEKGLRAQDGCCFRTNFYQGLSLPSAVCALVRWRGASLSASVSPSSVSQAAAPAAGGFTVVCEDGGQDPQVEALIRARADAKKAKNFAEADRIRDELKAQGVEITDVPGGVRWKRA